jgi:nitronate monooxygenase
MGKRTAEDQAMAALKTRVTERLGIAHPILSAPMARVAGGELAAAVSAGGGLGFLGGGYCESAWIRQELSRLRGHRFGFGAITWALDGAPEVLDIALEARPAAVFLSFGDPAPYAQKIRDAGAALIVQVQTVAAARHAAEAGADFIVAQGREAGGHGGDRATLPLVPAVADALAEMGADIPVLAAGGIADGRGLAAVLMLGAEGAVCGTAFCAAPEALTHPNAKAALAAASGDAAVRSQAVDIVRGKDWPAPWGLRALRSDFIARWEHDPDGLRAALATEAPAFAEAAAAGDVVRSAVIAGEAADLVRAVTPAGEILQRLTDEAADCLRNAARHLA